MVSVLVCFLHWLFLSMQESNKFIKQQYKKEKKNAIIKKEPQNRLPKAANTI